jgi:histidinol phosphatase-like enzyme
MVPLESGSRQRTERCVIDTFIFDLDGTLVEDHLVDKPCDRCEDGTENLGGPKNPNIVECRRCHGKQSILVPRRDRHYTDPALLPNVLRRIYELRRSNPYARFSIATNQGGIAMGFQTEEEVAQRLSRTLALLGFFGGAAFSVHYSPHHPKASGRRVEELLDAQLLRRKPAPGMLLDAMDAHGSDQEDSIFVGDRETDQNAAKLAGIRYCPVEDWLREGQAAFPPA